MLLVGAYYVIVPALIVSRSLPGAMGGVSLGEGGTVSILWLVSLQDGILGWHSLGLDLRGGRILVFDPGWFYPSEFGCLALHNCFCSETAAA